MKGYLSLLLMMSTSCLAINGNFKDGGLIGSRWSLKYIQPCFEEIMYSIELKDDGVLFNDHPFDVTVGNDRWRITGLDVTLTFNNDFAIYTGKMTPDHLHIDGIATSRTCSHWRWVADKLH